MLGPEYMKGLQRFEPSITIYQTAWHNIAEDLSIQRYLTQFISFTRDL